MKQPYISIITPCYNGECFIENAIQSILQQPLEEIELIIINDGSRDATEQICKKYSEKDNRIKIFTTENKGAGHARNYGIARAKGTWILFLDSDDLYLENSLNIGFVSKLNKYEKEKVDIVYTGKCMADMELKKYIHIRKDSLDGEKKSIPQMEFWTCIYRRGFIHRNNIKFYEYRRQDIESAFRYLTYSKAEKIIADNSMIFYVQRENFQSNTHVWNLQTMHEVKCMVYYDLYKNHSIKSLSSVLKKVFLQEMCDYYGCCNMKGVYDCSSLKNVNEIFRREIFNVNKNITLIGKRMWLKCLKDFFVVNYFGKKYDGNDSVISENVVESRSDEKIYDRLKLLSDFTMAAINEK